MPCKVAVLTEVNVTGRTPRHNFFADIQHMASFASAAFSIQAKKHMVNSVVLDEHRCQGFSYTHSFPGGEVPNHGTSKFNNEIQVGVTLLLDGPR